MVLLHHGNQDANLKEVPNRHCISLIFRSCLRNHVGFYQTALQPLSQEKTKLQEPMQHPHADPQPGLLFSLTVVVVNQSCLEVINKTVWFYPLRKHRCSNMFRTSVLLLAYQGKHCQNLLPRQQNISQTNNL